MRKKEEETVSFEKGEKNPWRRRPRQARKGKDRGGEGPLFHMRLAGRGEGRYLLYAKEKGGVFHRCTDDEEEKEEGKDRVFLDEKGMRRAEKRAHLPCGKKTRAGRNNPEKGSENPLAFS